MAQIMTRTDVRPSLVYGPRVITCTRGSDIQCLRIDREQHVPDFLQSFTLPDEAVMLQLSGGKLRRESVVRWFGFCLSLPSPSVSNDVHVSVETPTRVSPDVAFLKHTHTDTYTHRHIHKDTNAHSHVYAYVYENEKMFCVYVFVLETATRSKKT